VDSVRLPRARRSRRPASDKLIVTAAKIGGSLVLVGSRHGWHVSAALPRSSGREACFVLAPAFYMPGFEAHTPQDVACPATNRPRLGPTDIVPVDNSVRWAREHRAALHIPRRGHRLEDQIEASAVLLARSCPIWLNARRRSIPGDGRNASAPDDDSARAPNDRSAARRMRQHRRRSSYAGGAGGFCGGNSSACASSRRLSRVARRCGSPWRRSRAHRRVVGRNVALARPSIQECKQVLSGPNR